MTDTALCNKGHLVTYKTECIDDGPPKFCDKCGSEILESCAGCDEKIKVEGGRPPQYCRNCGAPFPWTGDPGIKLGGALA